REVGETLFFILDSLNPSKSFRNLVRLLRSLRSDRSRSLFEPYLAALRVNARITSYLCRQQIFDRGLECTYQTPQAHPSAIHSLQTQCAQRALHQFQISEDSPQESLLRYARPEQIGECSQR